MTRIAPVPTRWPFLDEDRHRPHLCTVFAAGIAAVMENRGHPAAAQGIRADITQIQALTASSAPTWAAASWDAIDGVCLVLIDGLGHLQLREHLAYAPFLRERREQLEVGRTIIPSSTAAAIPAATTGQLPGQTGMTGWSVRDGDQVVDLLSFRGASFKPEQYQSHPTLFERCYAAGLEVVAINSARFATSGLTLAALRGARALGAESLSERIEAAGRQMRAGTPIIYLYWHGLDHAGHADGVGSPAWCEQLEELDRALATLVASCPPNYAVILTSDHGMVNTTVNTRLDITEHPALLADVAFLAGDGRAAHLHAAPGKAPAVIARWREYLGSRAWVVPAADFAQLLGPGEKSHRIGDALVLMRGNWVVGDSRTQSSTLLSLTGVHGSVSRAEKLIPAARLH